LAKANDNNLKTKKLVQNFYFQQNKIQTKSTKSCSDEGHECR